MVDLRSESVEPYMQCLWLFGCFISSLRVRYQTTVFGTTDIQLFPPL